MNPGTTHVSTACLCICAAVGHHHGVCRTNAEPGLLVALHRSSGHPVKLPACRPCYDAVRRTMWADIGASRPVLARVTA